MEFPTIIIPEYYTAVFSVDSQKLASAVNEIENMNARFPVWKHLLMTCFKDVDKKGRLELIVKHLGWLGFRNRLTNILMHRLNNNSFPSSHLMEDETSELTPFELACNKLTVEGHSRPFLLAVYFKMSKLSTVNSFNFESYHDDLLKLVSTSKVKTIYADWIIIFFIHLLEFYDNSDIKNELESAHPKTYNEYYNEMTKEQKEILVKNYLAYGHACNDKHFFSAGN